MADQQHTLRDLTQALRQLSNVVNQSEVALVLAQVPASVKSPVMKQLESSLQGTLRTLQAIKLKPGAAAMVQDVIALINALVITVGRLAGNQS